jgi:hypothetical protein
MKIAQILDRFDDNMNPIVVKELLQAVKGRLIATMLVFFLIVQLVVIGGMLMFSDDVTRSPDIGKGIFGALYGILIFICLLFLPGYITVRMSNERADNNIDLFYITTLKPRAIIWGKLAAGIILALLMFSACMPFMALTYLLRGIDLPTIFATLAYGFLIVCAGLMIGIFLASLPGTAASKWFRYLLGFGILFFSTYAGFAMFAIRMAGFGPSYSFWYETAVFFTLMLLGIGLLFVTAVANVAPVSANRGIIVRPYFFGLWLITFVMACLADFLFSSGSSAVLTWAVTMTLLISLMLFIATAERPAWGPRIQRAIPKNPLLRTAAFFFYSGSANGLAFCIVLLIFTFALSAISSYQIGLPVKRHVINALTNNSGEIIYPMTLSMYFITYILTAHFIRRTLLGSIQKPALTAVIALALIVLGSVVPPTIGFFSRENPYHEISHEWFVLNPFVIFWEKDFWPVCMTTMGIWGGIALLLNLPWFCSRIAAFKPLTREKKLHGSAVQHIPA